ncbi:MAG: electron transport complex subunit RsxC [Ruminococcaceae bacterium]|nr:electron transport complex subunit RsxC [Oscillospiraceae bacterium]
MAFSIHGIHVPHRKNTHNDPIRMDAPKSVTIPMSMHIGAPSTPIVKVGDEVKVGTKIAEAGGFVSVPAYATVSGKVTKIQSIGLSNGAATSAVVIESDGEMNADESVTPPVIDSRESFIEAIKQSGIVGLGGAGFPTHVKLNVDPERIDYLIINGAECEPYVTSDTYTMTARGGDMERALIAFYEYLGIQSVIIGIESNKKAAIVAMQSVCDNLSDKFKASVKVLPSVYPQGGEKVLIYNTTGRVVSAGKLPIDVGCIVLNCTTLAAIGAYLKTGMPLVEKCVTVDGGAIKQPQNVIAPIGTKISDIFEFCGGLTQDPAKVIYGGPMMGITVPDVELPIMKNTNAVLALTEKEARIPKTTACIRCGSCTNTCPFGLAPAAIAKAYENKNAEALEELCVNSCMECGCCSYVCPANRPLVQTNKLSKAFLRESKAKEATK